MAEKSGSWFLELILNILLLAATAFVTFAGNGEQKRRAQAVVTPAAEAAKPAGEAPGPTAAQPQPGTPLPSANPAVPAPSPAALPAVPAAPAFNFNEAVGALGIWAAGLDGKITKAELDKVLDQVGSGWPGTQAPRDFLKSINERINQGKGDEILRQALETLATQANEKKTQVVGWIIESMKANGWTWDKIAGTVGSWVAGYLRINPAELFDKYKF